MNRKYPHFAIPEIYGESLSYYELLRKLVEAMNNVIENYDTIPDQIAEAVANLDASQLFSAVLNQLIESIATDNTKSANAVKVYKKHDLLYATFNETVNLYESLIDFSTGTETELIPGTNIREVNISELFIELRKLIDINKNNIEAVTAVANENSAEITTIHNDITSIENKNTAQDNDISTLRTMISTLSMIKELPVLTEVDLDGDYIPIFDASSDTTKRVKVINVVNNSFYLTQNNTALEKDVPYTPTTDGYLRVQGTSVSIAIGNKSVLYDYNGYFTIYVRKGLTLSVSGTFTLAEFIGVDRT